MLHSRGTAVFLVSGGFRQLIEPVAEHLHIPKDHIYANVLLFSDDGKVQQEWVVLLGIHYVWVAQLRQKHLMLALYMHER